MRRLGLAAAGAAVIGLTACSHSAAQDDDSSSRAGAPGAEKAPISCKQQYRSWTKGEGKGVMDALQGVSSAATAGGGQVLTVALKQAKPAVAKGARHPIPACADPRGYWTVVLMHLNAAAASNHSASDARVAMQGVPRLMDQLEAGVEQAAR
jgi:hypothetical protein